MKFYKLTKISLVATVIALFATCKPSAEAEKDVFIKDNVTFAVDQTKLMLEAIGPFNGKNYPRTMRPNGDLRCTSIHDWTPGFFPGALWYLYELTGDTLWQHQAEHWTYPLESQKNFTGNHDIGFMMYCSYGNAERLASKPGYEQILISSADALCTRFNDVVQSIESWDYRKAWDGTEWFFPVIIDNMLNLELLFYASKVTGDQKYYDIAVAHANTTLRNHFREDYSSYHVVDYDTETGLPLHKQTCQGYSDNSTWSRGQAWAVYGFTMMYRETKDPAYLEAAKNLAGYFLENLPDDLVPLWDFNVGMPGYTPDGNSYAVEHKDKVRDASAASIVCSALFELGQLANDPYYIEMGEKMLKSLASPAYRAELGQNQHFIIMHCTGSYPHRSEIDVPLTYADYYFLEALIRYKNLK